MATPSWFREIDHTGDVGVHVEAPSLDALFARAAWGMLSVLTDLSDVAPASSQPVAVEAHDREALMVRWLSDLNFLHVTEGWLFCDFDVEVLPENRLHAAVRGEHLDPDRHVLHTEIKAVTFHDLHIRRRGEAWHVQVIFDM